MQEFSSVTASSYDADSLAPMLAEKSAEGWSVISIVAAGTNIVAYLERAADESAAHVDDEGAVEEEFGEETTAPEIAVAADIATEEEEEAESTDDETPYVPTAAVAGAGAALAADEPAGWAVAPESETTQEPVADESLAGLVAEVEAAEPVAEPEPVIAEPEPVVAEPEPVVAAPAAVESAVPAGWYADPSGRFELRYWDGTAWTEHVSRAGQQFTDPPVA